MLLVYPEFFPTYWGMQHYLPLVKQKALMPPLGLITIAALTPGDYEFRLIDLNCEPLKDSDLAWADLVLLSAMLPQRKTLFQAARRCRQAGKMVVMGGPFPTACAEECRPFADVLVLNEGEVTWPMFLKDLEAGQVKPLYTSPEKPDVTKTPCPRFDLLNMAYYAIVPIQFSRGCPFQCEFCDIIVMYGRQPRTKTPEQLVRELDAVYATGYRGVVFIVDDNFIGNKKEVATLLPAITRWNQAHERPFYYGTEASVNLADDRELLDAMSAANFMWVFLGIETPSAEGLKETHKLQNVTHFALSDRVKAIQNAGILVYGGFIIGFDSDTEDIFDRQIQFITEAAIPNAMIGPLVALPGTPLHQRLKSEGRLLEAGGDEDRTVASGYTNIETKISRRALLEGHRRIIQAIYSPRAYFDRAVTAFSRLPRAKTLGGRLKHFLWMSAVMFRGTSVKRDQSEPKPSLWAKLSSFRALMQQLPIEYRREARRFAWQILKNCPEHFPRALGYMLMGYHYYRFTVENMLPELDESLARLGSPSPQPRAHAA